MKQTIQIQNLHCAACALDLQDDIQKIKGVNEVTVDFVSQKIIVDVDSDDVLKKVIHKANHFEEVKVLNEGEILPQTENHTWEIFRIVISAVLLLGGILLKYLYMEKANDLPSVIVTYAVCVASYLIVGYPVLINTAKNVVKGKIFDENFLMTLASIGAFIIGEAVEGVAVMLLYQIGEFLQELAVGSSRKSITKLMDLKSENATLVKDGEFVTVTPQELMLDDIILIKAGEKIPVDGEVIAGESELNTMSITGESALKAVKTGDEVLSGCINTSGNLTVKVIRKYTDSAVAKILDMVENSSSKKAEPEKFISKFAKYYTPIVCILALCIAVFVPLFLCLYTGEFVWATWEEWIMRALSLLVISCPCALIISVPLTYFGGIGVAAKYGILIKGATHLDDLNTINTVAFDKTGTLTKGNFNVVTVKGRDNVLAVATALENHSSHPLAKAFEGLEGGYHAQEIEEIAGKGIVGKIDGKLAIVGNASLLQEYGISVETVESISTVVYVGYHGEYLGCIEIDDKIKSESGEVVASLKTLGINQCVMVTGDSAIRADAVAKQIGGIDEIYAQLLPDEKVATIERLKEQGGVMYVGEGINDAPVMTVADCAVSMGKLGSDAAIEASNVVLVEDKLTGLPRAIKIGRKTKNIVLQNIIFSIVAKVAFMALSLVGLLPLWCAVFGDVGVMLLAVLNSLRMRSKIK